jgi:hypothetical protein
MAARASVAFDAPSSNNNRCAMIGLILRYGTVAGLIVAIPMVWRMLSVEADAGDPLGGMLIGYLTMLVALTAVSLGIKHYRDKVKGGVVKFLPAVGVGLAISAVAGVFYVVGWEISMAYSEFDFARYWSNYLVEGARAKGANAAELARAEADAQRFLVQYANPLWRIPMTFIEIFPVGVLVSLISAAILRNSRVLPARG